MYAIVEIAGQQFKVQENHYIYTHRLPGEPDATVTFDKVYLIEKDGNVMVGSPTVEGATVQAKIVEHLKGDKIIVFKLKRRKDYRRKKGHRQLLTKVMIEKISV